MSAAFWSHRSKTGRVVYDRPRNLWKVTDMDRIWESILRETFGDEEINQLVVRASLGLLGKVLAILGLERFTKVAYFWAVHVVNEILIWLGYESGLEFGKLLFSRLTSQYSIRDLQLPPQVSV